MTKTHWKAPATTAHEPVARVKVNAWGVATRLTDAVKSAVTGLPVAKLASIAKPVKQAKPVQRQRISDSKIAAILAPYGKHWNPAKLVTPAAPAKRALQAKPAPAAQPVAPAPAKQAAAPVITPTPAQPAKQAKLSEPIIRGTLGPMGAAILRAFQDRESKRMQAEAA